MSPPALLRSGLLSPLGKLRLLGEPLVRARRTPPDDDAETVAAFGARRLGRQAGRVLLETAVIGIYAGAAAGLSAQSAFPRLVALERDHGSLLRGVLAGRKRGKRPGHALSFPDGLGELTAALAGSLGGAILRGEVVSLDSPAPGRWRVSMRGGPGAAASSLEADAVVVATDADAAARLLAPMAAPLREALAGPAVAPIALCCLGFRNATAETLGMDLAAYGFLVARGEQPKLLGCQYESSIFTGRAPEGGVLLRAILGGVGSGFDPDVVERTDAEIAARACADLRTIAGLKRDPDLVKVVRYPRGIPQMAPGHAGRIAAVDAALAAIPGLFVLGQTLRGVGVNECIRAATALARERFGAPAV